MCVPCPLEAIVFSLCHVNLYVPLLLCNVTEDCLYKLGVIIYQCLHQTEPKYLQQLCVPVITTASRHHLRSAAYGDLQVLTTRTVTFGPPKLWNSLPPHSETRRWYLHNLAAGWKLTCFVYPMDAFHDCLGCKGCARYKFTCKLIQSSSINGLRKIRHECQAIYYCHIISNNIRKPT